MNLDKFSFDDHNGFDGLSACEALKKFEDSYSYPTLDKINESLYRRFCSLAKDQNFRTHVFYGARSATGPFFMRGNYGQASSFATENKGKTIKRK